jgi:2-polyprenyl-3-methyl-5-hydroxy-6-metoxy-1,4-benzoquinol methylase
MLTERQQREKEYYDQFAVVTDKSQLDVRFDVVDNPHERPWNPYWHLFGTVKDAFVPGAKLLDFGCGWGDNSIVFAKMGFDVHGFDISEGNLNAARALAEKYGMSDKLKFSRQEAEKLEFPDNEFDVIAGVDILHHVDIEPSIRECHRVLKPGGVAIFKEPIANPVFDTVRRLGAVRKLVPNTASFERHITEDERKLTSADLRVMERVFSRVEVHSFRIVSRLERLVHGVSRALEKTDYYCSVIPGYSRLRGTIVLTMRKES